MATTVVITGASAGVGRAVALEFARLGCNVALLARGIKPVVLPSHQFVGNTSAATQLEAFYEAYRKSLKHLFE